MNQPGPRHVALAPREFRARDQSLPVVICVTAGQFTPRVELITLGGRGEMVARSKNLTPSAELKEEFVRLATIVKKAKGTILFRRGERVSGLYLILSGRVSLGIDNETSVFPTRILVPGCIAGLPATVSGNPYSLTAEVVQDAELAFVSRDGVLNCLQKNPELCFQVMTMLSGGISEIRAAFKQGDSNRRARA